MSQSKWDDLYDRLTSRKLWLALLSIGFAAFGYHQGALTAVEFQAAVFAAVATYTAAEAATDTMAAWRPQTGGGDDSMNVRVNSQPAPATPAKLAPRRVRPSRAGQSRGKQSS